ncbi:MAG: T9SS type A sorting domain-containing protein [Candidatus Fermentibacteraceae bacterium]|nr:T9SS type A sorting domain-containing protein [Candidatus Fermentibacteraceae bacterium]
MKLAAVYLILAVSAVMAVPEGIPLQYMDSRGRQPSSTRVSCEAGRGAYSMNPVSAPVGSSTDGDKVVLLVDQAVFNGITASLSVFQSDLEAEGFTVLTWQISGGTATDIRTDLQTEYTAGNLAGAIAIGDIPTGWIENGYGEYPIDMYLMDMNGTWSDPDADGLFNSYSSGAPEIWLGRLTPTNLTFGSSVGLLNSYFARNHAYRNGTLTLPDRALAYEEAFTGLTGALDNLYDDVTRKTDPVATNADDFKSELLYGYQWVHLISHSSPWGSSFHTGAPPSGGGTLDNFEVPPLDPHAFFYVCNCCTNGRWTEVDNLANSYIWTDSYGLAALAQTKVDYTNYFTEYYSQLSSGSNLGDAYRVWLSANMSNEDGAVLFGDPTLKPRVGSANRTGLFGESPYPAAAGWLDYPLTDGLHSQGRVDTYHDPSSDMIFAVSGTSDPVRANILATVTDGDSWAAPMIVCQHEYWDWHPTVGGDGTGKVWTAWHSMRDNHEGYDIYLSLWNGSGWGAAQTLTTGDPFDIEPSLSGGNGHTWLVWQKWDGGDPDIVGRMWTGSQWTVEETIAGSDNAERYPDVAWNGSGYGVVYHRKSASGGWVIGFRDAPDSGAFGAETVISSASGENRYACIAGTSTGFAAVWQSQNGSIVYSRLTGSTWSSPEVVSGSDYGVRPGVAVTSTGSVIVSWTAAMNTIRYNLWDGSSWSGVLTAASASAIDDGKMTCNSAGDLWLVYGARGDDYQWDLRASTPDPSGIEETEESIALSVANIGSNPAVSSALFSVSATGEVLLTVHDMSGRIVHSDKVMPGEYIWNCSSSPAGIYIVRVSRGMAAQDFKLVVIR